MLVFHVNYFDISDFQGIGFGSAQDQTHAHSNPLRGPVTHKREQNPPPQPPGLGSGLDEIHESIKCAMQHLLRHTTFVAMSSQSEKDPPERHTSAWSTGGGRGRAYTGGIQVDPSRSTRPVPHRCSHCGNPC